MKTAPIYSHLIVSFKPATTENTLRVTVDSYTLDRSERGDIGQISRFFEWKADC